MFLIKPFFDQDQRVRAKILKYIEKAFQMK